MEATIPKKTERIERVMDLLEGQTNRGIYVWGGNGELLDEMPDPNGWILRHETNALDANRAIALYRKRIAAGMQRIRAFDCSGLIYWALKTEGIVKSDVNSRGLYALCEPIAQKDVRRGDLVFHHDGTRIVHVGMCAGTEQIECRGRDWGVVKNRRSAGYWNRFGRLKAFETDEKPLVYVKGGSVRVRQGDGVQTPCIGIAHRGDTLPYLGTAKSGWYRIAWHGRDAFITNKAQYTEVRHG